jgi:SAM-dependent methyltransferase
MSSGSSSSSRVDAAAAPACRRRDDCRLCGAQAWTRVLSLTPTPPANAFVPRAALGRAQPTFPLDVWFCGACGHVQLRDVVDPVLLFADYPYVSGTSPVFVRHFADYAAAVVGRFGLEGGDLVVDIGSNDGTLLAAFKGHGLDVLGIDPAAKIAAAATAAGIETWAGFFSGSLARRIVGERGPARAVTANNVFAHIDDLGGIADAVRALLAPDGVFVFEVSYLRDVYERTLFDTIYHEHLAYHSVAPLTGFFARHDLALFAVERSPSHGGSLRGYVQRRGGPRAADGSVAALVAEERAIGLDRAATLVGFAARIDAIGRELKALIARLKRDGKRLAGYGAPAKATTLMYHFGLGPAEIEFIVDDSPLKQGLYSPGLHVPVVPAAALAARRPDYLVVLAWNFAEPIIAKCRAYAEAGGRFIVPLPTVRVV